MNAIQEKYTLKDGLQLYARLVALKADRRTLIDGFERQGWECQPGSPQPKAFGNAIKRHVHFLTERDEVQFEFEGQYLRRILFRSRMRSATHNFKWLWQDFKADVKRQLPGSKSESHYRGKPWAEERCTWTWNGVVVAGQVYQNYQQCTIQLDIQRVPEPPIATLEFLFGG